MTPKLKFNSVIPKILGVEAIVLYPFIFFKHSLGWYYDNSEETLKHEFIHVEQIKRMGYLQFYITYVYYYFTKGYRNHPYEIEAFDREGEELTNDERYWIYGDEGRQLI